MASIFKRRNEDQPRIAPEQTAVVPTPVAPAAIQLELEIAPTDPLLAAMHHSNGALELSRLNLDSPALEDRTSTRLNSSH